MTRDVYQDLYSRGCVDVDPIPAMDLQNEIQTIFRPEAFRNLTAEQYEFIRPALTLASRLITEDAYMEFWVHLCSADPVEDSGRKRGADETKIGEVLCADPNIPANEAVAMARTALGELSHNLTFFSLDNAYSEKRDNGAGEFRWRYA
ncbi:hypothetical protein PtrM4_139580 [Pyrenophora tritici-repentis]|uniref:Uncharacterized protein n=1 Tax=Pyrenophora tritici-repentis TaxID=45151 RepID=A0A834VML0_9PLEO|nr:hypothetical protein PtrM4_139580 [Pyrenophora tritici-repentis]